MEDIGFAELTVYHCGSLLVAIFYRLIPGPHQHHRRPPLINPPGGAPCTSTTGDPPLINPPGGETPRSDPPIELPYCQATYPKTTIELPYLLENGRQSQLDRGGVGRGNQAR